MESRQSRMKKYYDNSVDTDNSEGVIQSSRSKRNQELYKEVSNLDLKEFDLNSNVSVIGENTDNISLDEIKDILSEKYKENPRNKSFGDTDEIALPKINLDETREYDINAILEKAKDSKESNYEEDRLKKVRSTQYDILKTLDIMNNEEEIEDDIEFGEKPTDRRPAPENEKEEAKLHDLIDTITAKELIDNESNLEVTGEMDPLDILSDLRGEDENTKVMGALVQELIEESKKENELALTSSIPVIDHDKKENTELENEEFDDEDTGEVAITLVELDKIKEESKTEETKETKKENVKEEKDRIVEDSFTGSTSIFKQDDFDDFDDLKDSGVGKVIIRVLIALVIVGFIVGCVVLANHFLDLGLF